MRKIRFDLLHSLFFSVFSIISLWHHYSFVGSISVLKVIMAGQYIPHVSLLTSALILFKHADTIPLFSFDVTFLLHWLILIFVTFYCYRTNDVTNLETCKLWPMVRSSWRVPSWWADRIYSSTSSHFSALSRLHTLNSCGRTSAFRRDKKPKRRGDLIQCRLSLVLSALPPTLKKAEFRSQSAGFSLPAWMQKC